jgi:hypothetical protein
MAGFGLSQGRVRAHGVLALTKAKTSRYSNPVVLPKKNVAWGRPFSCKATLHHLIFRATENLFLWKNHLNKKSYTYGNSETPSLSL